MTFLADARRILDLINLRGEPGNLHPRTALVFNQTPAAVATLVVLALIALVHPNPTLGNPLLWAGVAVVAAATAAAFLLPVRDTEDRLQLAVPLADIVGLSLLAIAGHDSLSGLSILLGLPFFWLAWTRLRPGWVRLASFAVPAAVVVFRDLDAGDSADRLLRALLIPIMILAFTVSVSVVSAIVADTERQLARALRESERRSLLLDEVLNAAHVGLVVVDEDGHDVLRNARQEDIRRIAMPADNPDPDEGQLLVFGADRATPLARDDRPVRRAVFGEEFSGQLVWIGEGPRQGAFAVSSRRMVDDAGAHRGAVVVFHEVTDLMDALAAKDQFLAHVNHELRTPLTSIIGYLELAQDTPGLPPEVAGYVGVARRNAERLLGLVADLLDAATGQLTVDAMPMDLAGIVGARVRAQAERARRAGIELVSDIRGPLWVDGDRCRIGQIVDNLLSNALKYTKAGGTVTVSAVRRDAEAVLEVADTGIGMEAAEVDGLFTRFYRTASVRQAAIAGAGLGLAISKELVDAHGGTIEVDSTPGRGSTFRVRLPAIPEPGR